MLLGSASIAIRGWSRPGSGTRTRRSPLTNSPRSFGRWSGKIDVRLANHHLRNRLQGQAAPARASSSRPAAAQTTIFVPPRRVGYTRPRRRPGLPQVCGSRSSRPHAVATLAQMPEPKCQPQSACFQRKDRSCGHPCRTGYQPGRAATGRTPRSPSRRRMSGNCAKGTDTGTPGTDGD
jgi:hypothetical protein